VRYVERIETTLTEEKKATRPNCKLFHNKYDCKYSFKACGWLCSQMSVLLSPDAKYEWRYTFTLSYAFISYVSRIVFYLYSC